MDEEDIDKWLNYFDEIIQQSQNRRNVLLTLDWKKSFPDRAGVYAFFKHNKIVYVGETGSIQSRMNDMRNTRNHTLRRNVGAMEFSKELNYNKATSKIRFHDEIEEKVNKFLCDLKVVALPISYGRKEIEEYMIKTYKPIYNQRGIIRGAV